MTGDIAPSRTHKLKMKGMAKDMLYFGYDNYMKYAFPEDELNPIDCQGRGPGVLNPILGSLISAHILLTDPKHPFGDVGMDDYDNDLLHLAHDLAVRLLPSFENTSTGMPHPRVNLKSGVSPDSINETCTSGAGSLMVEFGILSRLIGDSTFEERGEHPNGTVGWHAEWPGSRDELVLRVPA